MLSPDAAKDSPQQYQQIFLYGASYGTYLANRVMQIAPPEMFSAVVLDGIVHPAQTRFSQFDVHLDMVGRELLDACSVDPTCASYLTLDSVEFASRVIRAFENNSLPCLTQLGLLAAQLEYVKIRLGT